MTNSSYCTPVKRSPVRVSLCSPRSRHGNIELTVPKRMQQRRVAEEGIVGRQPKQIGERDSTLRLRLARVSLALFG
jgi:hypothetical protein